ncbi:MAG: hypothetical protein J6L64_01015 [Opitutales bacterium]|nr:hypothetical protein [Opitutales bacterium]
MNFWTQRSIDFANQSNYLDELFRVYPMNPEISRELDENVWKDIETCFVSRKSKDLIEALLRLELFPIKDSYVAYLRRDRSAIERNPKTINRLCGRLYELGLAEVRKRCETPKETNRQIGPMFRHWLQTGACGFPLVSTEEFDTASGDVILDAGDSEMKEWCRKTLGYNREKGLDFVARIKGVFVIGEAKFLTDFGGHQNAQLHDAFSTLNAQTLGKVRKIVIADGVCYIPGKNKMYSQIINANADVMSALCLRDFLHSL